MIRLSAITLCIASTGCAAPVAKQYLAACLESGTPAAECQMRAIEVNQRAWAGFSAGMNRSAASFNTVDPSPAPVHCIQRSNAYSGIATINCQ